VLLESSARSGLPYNEDDSVDFSFMPASQPTAEVRNRDSQLTPPARSELAAIVTTLAGLGVRIWMASATFLNPDEALHFRLANQPSLLLAYKQSLTASHPPLLTIVLFYWRTLGTSELWLRLPLVLASAVFCWIFYQWLAQAAGEVAAFVGLLFVAFLPPIVRLSSEIRQYPLLLVFLAGSLYFLDNAFEKKSVLRIALFSVCLYFAMLSHYSAFWFAAALGIYALFRIFTERVPAAILAAWIAGQLGGVALAIVLYKTHIAKLGAGYAKPVLQGWMSDVFLQHSYFNRAHDNPFAFLVGHSFGVFQYFFGQLAVGDMMGLLFIAGVILLLRGKGFRGRLASWRLALLLVLPFAIACGASLAHLYPYGGTRHMAFLIIPGIAGVSIAIAYSFSNKWPRSLAAAALVILACLVFGKERKPRMDRSDQSRSHMQAAMRFIAQNVKTSGLIFTDYQSDLVLGHYLCRQRPILLDTAPAGFEQFSCEGYRVISRDYSRWWFQAESFGKDWRLFEQDFGLKPETVVWVFQGEWDANLADELQSEFPEFHNLQIDRFGNNIKMFRLVVGDPVGESLEKTSDGDMR
jgi:hypothetical protein